MRTRAYLFGAAAGLALFTVAACDQKLAVQPARDHSALASEGSGPIVSTAAYGQAAPAQTARGDRAGRPAEAVRQIDGHPMWSDNRSHSAEENAAYQFEKHGAELGAKSLDEFVVKAGRFVNSPPEGTLTLTRANGDKLMFDPKSKLFGVARSDGAPRTVFKPEEGRAYWDQQVASQGDDRTPARRGRAASRDGGDDRS